MTTQIYYEYKRRKTRNTARHNRTKMYHTAPYCCAHGPNVIGMMLTDWTHIAAGRGFYIIIATCFVFEARNRSHASSLPPMLRNIVHFFLHVDLCTTIFICCQIIIQVSGRCLEEKHGKYTGQLIRWHLVLHSQIFDCLHKLLDKISGRGNDID